MIEDLLEFFSNFIKKNKLNSLNIKFFSLNILPKIKKFVLYEIPLYENGLLAYYINLGVRKEVYLFADFVIKFTNQEEIFLENEKKKGLNKDMFLDQEIYLLPCKISTKYNKKLHIDYIDCIIFQKRIKTFADKNIDKSKIITRQFDKKWLEQFLDLYWSESEKQKLQQLFIDGDILNYHNVGYDNNNQPVIFDI